ncbi:hypothetical protein BO79DRAFT_217794 [Aspergillus costaricaensis CBS 115574]|uniref:Uncharacterized protein n=1 Tax=Aspergillus costaricaensis CBS 115574 TaxID=1448317 RepID=A0ACD1IDA8_9EURO|nr:hypothetical protein BO79DRAFT_217794 [Aspergillus costaricaensis CBS 115574]RAK88473.1 hypothetical protein BO79DRAFT_217794 [Aspergillus costaricaensis CBS 115574]
MPKWEKKRCRKIAGRYCSYGSLPDLFAGIWMDLGWNGPRKQGCIGIALCIQVRVVNGQGRVTVKVRLRVRANITFSDYQQSYNPLEYLIVIFLASTSKTTHKVPRTDEKSLIILPPDTTSLSAALTQSHRMLWPLMALWDDIYTKLKQGGIPLSDTSNQGAGGILNEHIHDDRSTPIPGISF